MACKGNVTCDSQYGLHLCCQADRDRALAVAGDGPHYSVFSPFLVPLYTLRQCLCRHPGTPADSINERCLFWSKEGKTAWLQEDIRPAMLSRTSTWALFTWAGVTCRLSSPSPCRFTFSAWFRVDFCRKACAASPTLVPMSLFKDVDMPQTWGNAFNSVSDCIVSRKFSEQLLALATAWEGSVCRPLLEHKWFSEYSALVVFPHSHRPVCFWAFVWSPSEQFCQVWKWVRDCCRDMQIVSSSFCSRTEPQADTNN